MQITNLHHPAFRQLLQQIAVVSGHIHAYGWAEANAGNLSIDVTDIITRHRDTQNKWYIVSRTGSRYRQTALDPIANLLLVACEKQQDTYYPPDAKPSSEWISHRKLQLTHDEFSVILHTHPAQIIALSALNIAQESSTLNQMLAEILPEFSLYLPEGVAICPQEAPGSAELCIASQKALTNQRALIWTGHGLLAFANDLDFALDYLEITVKAAKLLFLRKATSQ